MSEKKDDYFEQLGMEMEETPLGSYKQQKSISIIGETSDTPIPDFITDSQKYGRCPLCQYEFIIGESIMQHFVDMHLEFLYMRLSK